MKIFHQILTVLLVVILMSSCDHGCSYHIVNRSEQNVNITITPPPYTKPEYNMWVSKPGKEKMKYIEEERCSDSTFICQFTLEPSENILIYYEFLGSGQCSFEKVKYTYEGGGSVTLEKDAVRKFFKEKSQLFGRSFEFVLTIE